MDMKLNSLCRVCLINTEDLTNIFQDGVAEIIMTFAVVKISNNDGFPQWICKICFDELKVAVSFKEKCEKSQSKLYDYITSFSNTAQEIVLSHDENLDFYHPDFKDDTLKVPNDVYQHQNTPAISPLSVPGTENCDNKLYRTSHYRVDAIKCTDGIFNQQNVSSVSPLSESGTETSSGKLYKILPEEKYFPGDKTQVGLRELSCEFCPEKFQSADSYKVHLLEHENRSDGRVKRDLRRDKSQGKFLPQEEYFLGDKTQEDLGKLNVYSCEFCSEKFESGEVYRTHLLEHDNASQLANLSEYTCEFCPRKFESEETYRAHLLEHENESDDSAKRDRRGNESQGNFLPQEHYFSGHKTQVDLANLSEYSCEFCPRKFDLGETYRAHLLEHENGSNGSAKKNRRGTKSQGKFFPQEQYFLEGKTQEDLSDLSEYSCEFCPEKFKSGETYRAHLLKHENRVKRDQRGTKSEGKKLRQRKMLQCELCGKITNFRSDLVRHMRLHSGERPYKCNICEKSFRLRSFLRKHLLAHDGVRSHHCMFCPKSFVLKSNLNSHLKTHSGEKKFGCNVCSKRFKSSRSLHYHLKLHTGERNFPCTQCEKAFVNRFDLGRHLKLHDKYQRIKEGTWDKSLERPKQMHQCESCGKFFPSRGDLTKHNRVHTGDKPFKCQYCDKAFAGSSALSVHVRIHTGSKPYTCHHCGQSFAQSSNLKVHIRLHTGVRPHICAICNKGYNRKRDLETHLNKHLIPNKS